MKRSFSVISKTGQLIKQRFLSADGFQRYSHIALSAYCLCAGLSIALSQIAVVFCIVLWAGWMLVGEDVPGKTGSFFSFDSAISRLACPIIVWCFISVLAAFFGINSGKAFAEFFKTGFYLLFPFAVYYSLNAAGASLDLLVGRVAHYFTLFSFSMTLAAIHSIASTAAGTELRPHIPGPVTESGQLALIMPILAALTFLPPLYARTNEGTPSYWLKLPALLFVSFLAIAWPKAFLPASLESGVFYVQLAGLASAAAVFYALRPQLSCPGSWAPGSRRFSAFLVFAVPLLSAVLVLNLKRGPWLGVFAGMCVFGMLTSARLIMLTMGGAAAALFALEPVRARFFAFIADFAISGGRKNMWALGLELISRFPLGLGLDNASFMRRMDPTLPNLHRHMHNNLLNVAVETGLLGLAAYLWWMITAIREAFLLRRRFPGAQPVERAASIISTGIGCSLLAWQLAGLVEYNFGDGEVRLIAFFLMGALIALADFDGKRREIKAAAQWT